MKQLLFIIYFVLYCLLSFAQQTSFEKTYIFLTNEEAGNSCIQDDDGGFVIGIGPVLSTQYIRDFGIIKLNNQGDTLWHTTFFMNYYATLKLVKKATDSGYITIGLADDSSTSTNNKMLWIANYDSLGFLNWSRFYSNPQFRFDIQTLSADFVSGNRLLICDGLNGFILLDSAFNISSVKKYQYFFNSLYLQNRAISYNSTFWHYYFHIPLLFGPYTVRLLEIGQSGDSLKSIQVTNDTLSAGKIVKVTSSYFIATGYKLISPSQSAFFVSKIDSSGTKLWSKRLSPPWGLGSAYQYSSYTTLLNGNHVACFLPSSTASDRRGFIYCFNDNGDSLWTQYFKDDTTYATRLLDIIATSDSGLLACGQIEEPGGVLKDYIVKTNSNGIILNAANELLKKKENYLHLYPNPATSYCNMHYIGSSKNAELIVRNMHGQLIYREVITTNDATIHINTSGFAPGIYFCVLRSDENLLLSKKLAVLR